MFIRGIFFAFDPALLIILSSKIHDHVENRTRVQKMILQSANERIGQTQMPT
jgi:hypothetical protein